MNSQSEASRQTVEDGRHDGALVVLYDGVCGLCDRGVQFLLSRDDAEAFRYAPLQGPTAKRLLDKHGIDDDLSTMVAVTDFGTPEERAWVRSDALVRIAAQLGGIWRALSWLRVVPRAVRDLIYGLVVRLRYRVFGKFDACKIPTPEQRARFLD